LASNLPAPKFHLRSEFRRRRLHLARATPDAAARAAGLAPMARLASFTIVSGYKPVGAEIDPGPLLGRLIKAGCRLVLPVAARENERLLFRAADAARQLVSDELGVLAPDARAQTMVPQLVIAPLLAFDGTGARLGQGGGWYDRTLAFLRASGRVFVLGLAYSGQEAERLPTEPHDQPLDAVLTEQGYRDFSR